MSELQLADLVIKAGVIHSMSKSRNIYRAIALRNDWIVAVSEDRDGLDSLVTLGSG